MKQRLDVLLVARGLAPSREQAQGAIMAGEVFVDGKRVDKAGMQVPDSAELELRGGMPYVSRGGYKLAAALDRSFNLDDERMLEMSWQLRNTAVSEFVFSAPRFSLSMFNALPHLTTAELITHI